MAPWENYLKAIYYDPKHPAGFAGPHYLYKVVQSKGQFKIGKHGIRRFLQDKESYSLHKPVRRRFQRNHTVSAGKDDLWMADLIDMVKYASKNDDFKYILLVIDTFSKYLWLQPLKYKMGDEVAKAFQKIFNTSKRLPAKLITDKGQEFKARKVQDLIKKEEIHFFTTQKETKASTSERAILTMKTRLNRYFSYKESTNYLPILQDIAENYNHTYHSTIDMRPVDVKATNEEEVRLATYFAQNPKSRTAKLKPFKFKIGAYVWMTHLKSKFTRANDQTYTGEVFKVHKGYHRGTLPIFRLRDLQDEDIKRTFYQCELQRISVDPYQKWKKC